MIDYQCPCFSPPQSVYDTEVVPGVYDLPRVDIGSLTSGSVQETGPVQIRYSSKKEFEILAKKFKIMSDFRVSSIFNYCTPLA